MKPVIVIEYCPKCGWLLRAAYTAQELLTTFTTDLHAVSLRPSDTAGAFIISIDDTVICNRSEQGGFMEIKELKQRIRDVVNPAKNLGHSDVKRDPPGK